MFVVQISLYKAGVFACLRNPAKRGFFMEKKETIAFILAHPDDEAIPFGLPRELVGKGQDVHLVAVSDGSLGSHNIISRRKIARIRKKEFHKAAQVLGVKEQILGVQDGAINPLSHRQRRKLVRQLREINPDIVIIPAHNDYHDDHIKTNELAKWAIFHLPDRPFITRRFLRKIKPITKPIAVYEADTQGSQTWNNIVEDVGQDMQLNHVNTILPISQEAIAQSELSFRQHTSQLQGKDYVALAIRSAQRRGRQIGTTFGVGLNFINFGGYAFSTENKL